MKKIFFLIFSFVFTSSLFASDYYWVGSSGANWGTVSNWKLSSFGGSSASVLPGASDNIVLGNGSNAATITLNISDTINNITIQGSGQIFINTSNGSVLRVEGNLTASNTNTTGGGSAVILFGGSNTQSLTGSTTGINKSKLPNLTIEKSGGTLTFYNTITLGGSTKLRYVSGTVDAGTSVFVFYLANVTQGKITLYDAVFEGSNTSYKMIDTLTVTDTLKTTGSSKCELDSGVIILTGNLRIENTSGNARGGVKILLRGTSNQTLSAPTSVAANQGEIFGIFIQKTSGTVHMKGKITLYQWENNYSTSNVYADSSTVVFDGGNSNALGGTYSTHFWDVDFSNKIAQTTIALGTGSVSKVMHNLIISGTSNFTLNSYTIEVEGNLTLTNTSNSTGGSGTIKICGSANQTLTGTGSTTDCELPSLTIDKSGGTATMSGFFNVRGNFTYIAGTVDATTNSSTIFKYTGTLDGQGTSSTMTFNNVNIERQVTIGGTLNVNGALTLTNGNSFSSGNHSINLQGDLTVNDAFAFSSSVITFKGNNSQAVNGTTAQTFYKVIVNKGANHITLSKNLTITNNLTLTAGNIISGSSALVILNDNATVSSANDNSFVSGPIKKIGNDAFTFPTGKSSYYHAIGITAPSSTSDAFTAEYFASAYSDLTRDTSLTFINNCEYWTLDRTTGSSNIKVTLNWTSNTCDIYTLSTLRVSRYDVGTSKWKSVTTATTSGNTTTGSIQTDNNQSTFGYFAIGKRSPLVYAHAGIDATICNGSSTTIGASPAATGGLTPYSYSWSPSTGLSATNVENPTASPSTTKNYILTVTDLDHSTAKDTMILTVNSNPVSAHAGTDIEIEKQEVIIIGDSPAASGGSSPYSYSWFPTSGLSSTVVDQPDCSPNSDTKYFLRATDQNGCIGIDSIVVSILDISHFDSLYLDETTYVFDDTLKIYVDSLFPLYKFQLGLGADDSMIEVPQMRVVFDEGKFYRKYEHYHKGYKVEGDMMNVMGQYDIALVMNGFVIRNLDTDIEDFIDEEEALDLALTQIAATGYAWEVEEFEDSLKAFMGDPAATYFPTGELIITKQRGESNLYTADNYHLVWHFNILSDEMERTIIDIDALTGDVFNEYQMINTDFMVNGTVSTFYNGTKTVSTRHCSLCINYKTWDINENLFVVSGNNAITDGNNVWNDDLKTRPAGTLFWELQNAHNFYKDTYNRNGSNYNGKLTYIQLDNIDANLVSAGPYFDPHEGGGVADVIVWNDYNEYWYYATLDVAGHEFTHAMLHASSNFGTVNNFESQALNEGLADIMGEAIEDYTLGTVDWIHDGENGYGDHRDFEFPSHDLDNIGGNNNFVYVNSPEIYSNQWPAGLDFHWASGPLRKWFYLLAEGGNFNGVSVSALGFEKARDIVYITMTWWIWDGLTYPEFAHQSIAAMVYEFGKCSPEHLEVINAWNAVGIKIPTPICPELHIEGATATQKTAENVRFVALLSDEVPKDGTFVWSYPSSWTATTDESELIATEYGDFRSAKIRVAYYYNETDSLIAYHVIHFSDYEEESRKGVFPQDEELVSIFVYPNPNSGSFNLVLSHDTGRVKAEVFKLDGQLVYSAFFEERFNAVTIPNASNGTYLVRFTNESMTVVRKIVIEK